VKRNGEKASKNVQGEQPTTNLSGEKKKIKNKKTTSQAGGCGEGPEKDKEPRFDGGKKYHCGGEVTKKKRPKVIIQERKETRSKPGTYQGGQKGEEKAFQKKGKKKDTVFGESKRGDFNRLQTFVLPIREQTRSGPTGGGSKKRKKLAETKWTNQGKKKQGTPSNFNEQKIG